MLNNKKENKTGKSPVEKKDSGFFSYFKKSNSPKKKTISKKFNRRLVSSIFIFALGISTIPLGVVLGTDTESYSNPQIVEQQFPTVLLSVKNDLEEQFFNLIEEMKSDPLNGLLVDELPIPEDIFFEEWANDRFPKVNIPTIGGYIEYVGAKAVGDIDLDNNAPNADLNITSNENPSGISIEQCQSLWDTRFTNSLVSKSSTIWFKVVRGSSDNRDNLKEQFNLTENQVNLICNWINTSQNTWLPYLALKDRIIINPLPFFGFLSIGALLLIYSIPKVTKETRKILKEKKSMDSNIVKTKIRNLDKDKKE